MYKKILIPVNLKHVEQSKKSLETACTLAKQHGAKLYVLTVGHLIDDQNIHKRPEDDLPVLKKFVKDNVPGDVDAEAVLKAGSTSRKISETAEELGVDLIVMNSHNPKFTDYLIGSNAAHVALHSPCSVFIVRD